MTPTEKKMKPIWYLVGLVLLAIGLEVIAAGIYHLIVPPDRTTELGELRPDLWWGGIMIVAGLIFTLTHRNAKAQD